MKYKIIKLSSITALGLLATLSISQVSAEEIAIENNGSGSNNEVTVQSEIKTEVKQENTMEVTNNVTVDANTGGNEANNNTGDATTIQTGDVHIDVNVTNSGNISISDTSCNCPNTQGTVSVSGNGAGSSNTVGINNTTSNNINVTNTANVTNNMYGKAVTGKNEANGNLGDVFIKTGSIYAKESIKNGLFNYSYVSAGLGHRSYLVKVDSNGADSENNVFLNNFYENDIDVENEFNIFNESTWDLITGKNEANKNNGDVVIKTGDIKFDSEITNKGNVSVVEVECCKEKPEKPEQPETPPTPPSNGGNGGNGGPGGNGGGNGSSGGANGGVGGSIGDSLPKTGGLLFFFILLNAIFLLFGAFMRLRAGRSPSFAFAI